MPDWDYSGDGIYFITLVTRNRDCLFGKIENREMILSDFGEIAKNEYYRSFKIRQELTIDEFVIMPNHMHFIIIINKIVGKNHHVETNGRSSLSGKYIGRSFPRDDRDRDIHGNKPENTEPIQNNNLSKFYRKPVSLSSFIAGYKTGVIQKIDDFIDLNKLPVNKFNRNNKLWQSNYHDHIIRNDKEYWRIKNYIKNNPLNWQDDEFNG